MPTTAIECDDCGSVLDPEATGGFCARCLLGTTLTHSVTESLKELSPDSFRIPNIKITEVLGAGAMSTVFRARQTKLHRDVAVKVIAPHLSTDPEFIERFFREAQTMAKLSHPSIVGVFEIGETDTGQLYLVMELVEGITLRERIEEGPIPPVEAIRMALQVCYALEYAHGKGVIHRDVKPSNILIDRENNAQLADFGISQLITRTDDEALTATFSAVGTPEYVAPEQLDKSETLDHRVDIYSLGVTFYQMIAGVIPRGMWYFPSKLVEDVDKRYDRVIDRVLQNDPEKRYQTAKELEVDLRKLLVKPSRVLAWIFVVMSLAIIGYLSFFFTKSPPLPSSIITADREVVTLSDSWRGSSRPWLDPILWGEVVTKSPEQLSSLNFVARQGIALRPSKTGTGRQSNWPGQQLRLVPGSVLELWESGSIVDGKELVLDGGSLSFASEFPTTDTVLEDTPSVNSIQAWCSGEILVKSPSQIDLGSKGSNRLQLSANISGVEPLLLRGPDSQARVHLLGDNEGFTGGSHVMATVVSDAPFGLGKGPVLIDGGSVEISTATTLGHVEIRNRGRIEILEETIFQSLVINGVALPPGSYEPLVDSEWGASILGSSSYHVRDLPPNDRFPGALAHRLRSNIPTSTWKGLPVIAEDGTMVITGHDEVRSARKLRGIHQFPAKTLKLEKSGRLEIAPRLTEVVFSECVLNGGEILVTGDSDCHSDLIITGTFTLKADSEIIIPEGASPAGSRLKISGELLGEASLRLNANHGDHIQLEAKTQDFSGRVEIVNGILTLTRSDQLRKSDLSVDGGTLISDYHLAPRVEQIELRNGGIIDLHSRHILIGALYVDGTRIPDGTYSSAPWLQNSHGQATVRVAPF